MINTETTIASLPNDLFRDEIFPHLESYELALAGQVCKSWQEHARQEQLWTQFPEIAKEDRFATRWISKEEWEKKGAASIEERVIEFFQRCPIKPSSNFEMIFAHDPDVRLSLIFDDYTTTSFISNSGEHVLRERCFVSSNEISPSGETAHTTTVGGYNHYEEKFKEPRYQELARGICGYNDSAFLSQKVLPMRQFVVSYTVMFGPFYQPIFDKDCFDRIYKAAEDRIYELDKRIVDAYVAAEQLELACSPPPGFLL